MSRFIPIGQLDYFGTLLIGVGFGVGIGAGLRDWAHSDVIRLSFAVMMAGALLRTVDWWRKRRASRLMPHS